MVPTVCIRITMCIHSFTFKDHSCLSFSPADEGRLEPLSRATVTVECQPRETGRLRSIVQLLVNDEHYRYVVYMCIMYMHAYTQELVYKYLEMMSIQMASSDYPGSITLLP